MMFIALARAAGVDAYAQMSGDTLAMRLVDDTLMRAKHVKAGIEANSQQYTVDVGWRSVVAERRPRRISDAQLEALLHNNNEVENLQRGDMTRSEEHPYELQSLLRISYAVFCLKKKT